MLSGCASYVGKETKVTVPVPAVEVSDPLHDPKK